MAMGELLRGLERLVVVACVPLLILIGYQLFRMGVAGEMKIAATFQRKWSGSISAVAPGSFCFLLGIALGAYIMFSKVTVSQAVPSAPGTGTVTYSGLAGRGESGRPEIPLSVTLGAAYAQLISCEKAHPGSPDCQKRYDEEFRQTPTLEDFATICQTEMDASQGSGAAAQKLTSYGSITRDSNMLRLCIYLFVVCLAGVVFHARTAVSQQFDSGGGCMIIHKGNVQQPVPDLTSQCSTFQSTLPNGASIVEVYRPVVPFLSGSFDDAERAHCGVPGCASKNRHVRIIIYGDGRVGAFIGNTPSEIRIWFSTGLIDFINIAVTRVLDDAVNDPSDMASPTGFRSWMASLSSQGGQQCKINFPTTALALDTKKYIPQIVAAAAYVYTFIFAHELSHFLYGSTCQSTMPSDPMSVEEACDRIGFGKMMSYGMNPPAPIFIIAALIGIHHYERLAGRTLSSNGPLELEFPARDLTTRAKALSLQWQDFCESSSGGGNLCTDGWVKLQNYAAALTDIPLPQACH